MADTDIKKVIVFGSLNMDMSVECARVPRRGETVRGDSYVTTPGGKGGNQAVACARMGVDTFMVGKVGNDAFGRVLVANLTRHGVSTANVSVTAREETGAAVILRAAGDARIVFDPGANQAISYDEVRAAIHGFKQNGNIFLTQLECDPEVTMQALLCAKRNGLYTVLNAAPAVPIPDEVASSLDLLCVNSIECEELSGISLAVEDGAFDYAAIQRALEHFASRGIGATIITLGKQGSVTLGEDGRMLSVAAYGVDAVDSTGAGDAYLGGLVASLALGKDRFQGMRVGTAAAALCVTRLGAQKAMPSWDEVTEFIADNERDE